MVLKIIHLRLILTGICLISSIGYATPLKIAYASEPTNIDPHNYQLTPNIGTVSHIYEALTYFAPDMTLIPALAESWRLRDDTTWEFKLRPDVKFSNGEPFTAKDVIFTMCRTLFNPESTGGFNDVAKRILNISADDDHTVVIKTDTAYPILAEDLAGIFMIWHGLVKADNLRFDIPSKCGVTSEWPTVNDFNTGKAAIGTGPYVFKSYTKGGRIEFTRNDHYWGGKQPWSSVTIAAIPTAAARVTAITSGDYDIVENVSGRDLELITSKGLVYSRVPSVRVIFLELDVSREQSPRVISSTGTNPLRDPKVRRAMALAIDREAIVKRIIDGSGVVANQFLPDGLFGSLQNPPVIPFDPEQAKHLLTEAGYPNGFELVINGPNDRYIGDAQIVQAIAQYWNRIGIKTKVETLTRSVYFARRDKAEFSVSLMGWASSTGEASNFMRFWLVTRNLATGIGISGQSGYSSESLDGLFHQAMQTMDKSQRAAMLQQAIGVVLDDLPYIPLHFESSTWAHRPNITYQGRRDQRTVAMFATPKP